MSGNENGLKPCRDSPITLTMKTWFDKRKLNLNSGRLLAHEIGHALGANHDDGAKTQILLLESSCRRLVSDKICRIMEIYVHHMYIHVSRSRLRIVLNV